MSTDIPLESQEAKELSRVERAIQILEEALSGYSRRSKNNLIQDTIAVLKTPNKGFLHSDTSKSLTEATGGCKKNG